MNFRQNIWIPTLFLAMIVGFAFAGTCQARKGGPYYALSQDGSTVVGEIDNHAFKLQDGVTTDLGTLGGDYSYATAVSADGAVVVGNSTLGGDVFNSHAFRWADGTMTDLGTLGGDYSYANAVSADGAVVVGYAELTGNNSRHAFRWANGTMTDLGTLGGSNSYARAVSADGAVVVGDSDLAGLNNFRHAFRWADGTMTDLGTLGGSRSYTRAVSADGAVVVGEADLTGDSSRHAFRWANGTMTDLGTLGGDNSYASDVSTDGTVVIGNSTLVGTPFGSRAFRWTNGTMTDLGTLGGDNSHARAMSADGAVVVGRADTVDDSTAFRWQETTGMLSVAEWLEDEEVNLAGWDLREATGVSGNGLVLIGDGINPDGEYTSWMARKSALIDPVQWLGTVSGARQIFHTGTQLSTLALYGAHHRPLMSYDQIGKGLGFWATGDLGIFTDEPDLVSGSVEIGLYNDYLDGRLRAGLGFGYSGQRQDLPLSGSSDLDGGHLVGELNWRTGPADQLIASLTASYGHWNAEVKRGYLNGAAVDHSLGDTDVQSLAMRLKLDWQDAARLGPARFDPYAGLTFSQIRVDSYTETNGSVPASFDTQKHDAQELRAGIAGIMAVSKATQLRLTIEGVHRFDDRGPALSGQDMGGFGINFNIPADKIDQTWMRGGAEIDYSITESSMLAVSLNGATQGQDPDVSGAVSYRMRF